jgi:SAM-dependent methyltransferase
VGIPSGCGTGNTSIALARRNPDVAFVGVDQSSRSLEEARAHARAAGVANLTFESGDLMMKVSGSYDLILCLGVLHHTACMELGLRNLGSCLRSDGSLYLWLYGCHGRYRHTLNRRLLCMLAGAEAGLDEQLSLARELVAGQGYCCPLDDLLGPYRADAALQSVLHDPVWLADQFVSPHEELVDMGELLRLITACGLELKQWLGAPRDPASCFESPALRERFAALGHTQRLLALDLLLKPERYFVQLGRADALEG